MTLAVRTADDDATDYAGRDEIIAFLGGLLEAERAGARVTGETALAAGEGELAKVLDHIHHDEARWCGMLIRAIRTLGGKPSTAIGAFHGKAMAIADVEQRVAFINRGQGWVVRQLEAMVPRIRDPALRSDLAVMLQSHRDNIVLAGSELSAA